MFKSMLRAERRWRSRCTFLRRLKLDWNQHGWNWNARSYDRGFRMTNEAACSFWAGTDLCECFYDPKAQARFKDTPKECACWACSNPRTVNAGKNSTALTFAEHQAALDDREDWHKRRRRDGLRLLKFHCSRCGVMLGKSWVQFHRTLTRRHVSVMCERCNEALKQKTIYWFNGKRQEFVRPA